ncbi:hypothetical protein D030_1132B, partial [Vibrio parahaemolyticus AQ3810]
PLQDKL